MPVALSLDPPPTPQGGILTLITGDWVCLQLTSMCMESGVWAPGFSSSTSCARAILVVTQQLPLPDFWVGSRCISGVSAMTCRWLLILLLQVSSLTPGLKLIWSSHHEYSCSYIVVNVWPWRHWVGHGPALASSRTAFKAADKVTLPLAIPLALQSRRTRDILHSFSSQSS